mgnify:CR=1 FL=1
MKESKRWQDILISAGIFAAATFIIAGLCGLVCALFMKPLGFRYESLWDIVVFFFWGSLVAIPISLVAAALPKALYAACCTWRWTPLPRPWAWRWWICSWKASPPRTPPFGWRACCWPCRN